MSRLILPITGPSEAADAIPPADGSVGGDVEEPEDFDVLFRSRYTAMVKLAITLLDDRLLAEEVVQEAFRRLWERWADVQFPVTYLRVSVVNGCHQELRKRKVRRRHDRAERPENLSPEQHYLLDALAGIPLRRRTALVLRFYGQLSMAEIAETMDVSVGTAKSMVSRGVADLRKVIS